MRQVLAAREVSKRHIFSMNSIQNGYKMAAKSSTEVTSRLICILLKYFSLRATGLLLASLAAPPLRIYVEGARLIAS